MDTLTNIIIIGCDHTNTLGLIRSFGEAGIKPNLIMDANPNNNMCSHSKYLAKVVYVKDYIGIDKVIKREFPEGGVIITISDSAAEYLDRVYNNLSDSYKMPSFNNEGGHFKKYISKETQRSIAEINGILTPKSWMVNWRKESKVLPSDIIYPCIIKAEDSEIGPKDINIFYKKEELIKGLDNLARQCLEPLIQIQEFIKKDKEIVFIGYANGKEDICIPCMLEKGIEYPQGFGWYLFGTLTPEVNKYIDIKKIKELIAYYNYSGPFSLDFLISGANVYLCEINFRNDGNGYYPTVAGVNIPFLWYKSVTGQGENNNNKLINKEISIIKEKISFRWAKEQKQWWCFIKRFISSDVKEVWNKKDPLPFMYSLKEYLSRN